MGEGVIIELALVVIVEDKTEKAHGVPRVFALQPKEANARFRQRQRSVRPQHRRAMPEWHQAPDF